MRESEKFISNKDPHLQLYPCARARIASNTKGADRAFCCTQFVSESARPFFYRGFPRRARNAYIIDIKRRARLITLIRYNPRCAQKDSTSGTVRNKRRKSLRLRRAPVSVILRGLGTIINNPSIAFR